MSIFFKKKISRKKIHSLTTHEVTRTLRNIFSQAAQYDSQCPIKKWLNGDFSGRELERIKRAHIFVTRYFHTKNHVYQIVQTDRGKNLHLSKDTKTAITSPFADTAKLIPVPILGHVVAAGLKQGLKIKSDQKRIQRARDKSIYLLLDNHVIALMALIFVTIHQDKITDQTIKESCHNLNKELELFFSIAKKQMANHADPENLDNFWVDVLSMYLQFTVQHNTPDGDFFSIDFSLKEILNNKLKSLLETLKSPRSAVYTKKTLPDSEDDAPRSLTKHRAMMPHPPPNPQPGPEITFTLNPTLSPQGLTLTNPPPKALTMNLIIPENPRGHPITIRVPSVNQPLLINLLADTSSTVYATQASQTHPVVLANPSPPTTTPPCNPSPTHLTTTGRTEVKPLPVQPRVTSGEAVTAMRQELTPMTKSLSNTPPSPLITTSPAHATTATLNKMNKTETPQSLSRDTHSPAVTLSQLQACVELTACVAALALTQHASDLPIKSGATTGLSQTAQYTFKPGGPAFFSCGTATQQINNRPSCAHLSPAAA